MTIIADHPAPTCPTSTECPCRQADVDPDDWFPYANRGPRARRAKAACSGCPEAERCILWGMFMESTGIFGGMFLRNGKPEE